MFGQRCGKDQTSVIEYSTVKPHIEAAASTQVRSPVRLIGSGQSQAAAYTTRFLSVYIQYLSRHNQNLCAAYMIFKVRGAANA